MKKIFILIGLAWVLGGLNAQNFYDFKGVGARAAGMAFAFNAVADDATAISWNPAGITQLKSPEFSVIQRLQLEEGQYGYTPDESFSYNEKGNPFYTLDYLSFVYPLSIGDKNLVLGLAYQNQINYKFKSTRTYPNSDFEGDSKGVTTVNSVSLAAAYALNDFLSAGVAFNYYFSLGNRTEWNYFYRFSGYDVKENDVEVYAFSGFNLTAGAFADFSSMDVPLRLAARINTPLELKDDFSYLGDYHYIYPDNDGYGVLQKEGTETFHIPLILGTGVSYRFGDFLTLAADYDIKPFKDAERTMLFDDYDDLFHDPPKDELVDSSAFLVATNDNLNQFRIGLEYILHPEIALIPLRIGWKNNPTHLANQNADREPVEQVRASSFNMGVGLISKNFSVDFAYEFYKYTQEGRDSFSWDYTLQSFIVSLIVYIR